MGIDARLRAARLLLTMSAELGMDSGPFAQGVFSAGVNGIGVRAPGAEPEQTRTVLDQVRAVGYDYQGLVIVHDDVELAAAFGADVLHLGQAAGPAAPARQALHQWARIGRSCHSAAQVDAALADTDVDYFYVGPVWSSSPDPAYPAPGLDLVRHAASVAPPGDPKAKPWFAVGGIDERRLDEVLAAGARRICVVGAITGAEDPPAAAERLADRLRRSWADDPAMGELPGGRPGEGSGGATLKGAPE